MQVLSNEPKSSGLLRTADRGRPIRRCIPYRTREWRRCVAMSAIDKLIRSWLDIRRPDFGPQCGHRRRGRRSSHHDHHLGRHGHNRRRRASRSRHGEVEVVGAPGRPGRPATGRPGRPGRPGDSVVGVPGDCAASTWTSRRALPWRRRRTVEFHPRAQRHSSPLERSVRRPHGLPMYVERLKLQKKLPNVEQPLTSPASRSAALR